jgi:hypothetical protein
MFLILSDDEKEILNAAAHLLSDEQLKQAITAGVQKSEALESESGFQFVWPNTIPVKITKVWENLSGWESSMDDVCITNSQTYQKIIQKLNTTLKKQRRDLHRGKYSDPKLGDVLCHDLRL